MNQETRFRFWHEEYQEMVFLKNSGLQYFDFEGSYSLGFTVDGYSGFWAHEQYERLTKEAQLFRIMQFTGVLDKNGKDIYEGDIVLQLTNNGYKPEEVKFDFGCFYAGFHTGSSTQKRPKLLSKKVEVVGNIYENVELLK
jgi:uncharacterized phage protein (TIGR01671 family)